MQSTLQTLVPIVPMINSIKADIQAIKADVQVKIEGVTQRVSVLEQELANVKTANETLADVNSDLILKLLGKLQKLESYSRRNNMIIYGIPENDLPLSSKVTHIFASYMKLPDIEKYNLKTYTD